MGERPHLADVQVADVDLALLAVFVRRRGGLRRQRRWALRLQHLLLLQQQRLLRLQRCQGGLRHSINKDKVSTSCALVVSLRSLHPSLLQNDGTCSTANSGRQHTAAGVGRRSRVLCNGSALRAVCARC